MKNLLYLSLSLSILCSSCGSQTQNKNVSATPVKSETTQTVAKISIPKDSILTLAVSNSPQQSYCIYYPSSATAPDNAPIIAFFDPHGAGNLPIGKYKKLADRFGIALAGSNSSKNGLNIEDGKQIAANMEGDIVNRLGFNKHNMTLAGFSGGAKVALAAVFQDGEIGRAIYMGAASPFASTHTISLMGFAGQQDMNYTDLLAFDENVNQSKPGTAVLIEHGGKHEWPDAAVFEKAFYWLAFQTQGQDSLKLRKIVNEFVTKENLAIASANMAKDRSGLINAYQENKTALFILNKVHDVAIYQSNMQQITQNKTFEAAQNEKKQMLSAEANTKQMLIQAFQNQGSDWWAKVIGNYKASKNPSDKRLLGFISLACYSYSNQSLQSHNLDGAEKILAIYELCDATNTDQLFFHAMLHAQKGNADLALKYLSRAAANGFDDRQKMESEPSFAGLRATAGYAQILASLGKKPK